MANDWLTGLRNLLKSGGETGIRTLDTVSRIHAFQACAFSHSAISPRYINQELRGIGVAFNQAP